MELHHQLVRILNVHVFVTSLRVPVTTVVAVILIAHQIRLDELKHRIIILSDPDTCLNKILP